MPHDELDQAIGRFRAGGYEGTIATGGPVHAALCRSDDASYAELARHYLV